MLKLRREIQQNYEKRGTDTVDRVSEEDINKLYAAKNKIYTVPLISLTATFAIGWLMTKMNFGAVMVNHLEQQSDSLNFQRRILQRTRFGKMMKGQGLIIVGIASTFLSWVYYQGVKYSIFLKYENLVNSYARALNEDRLQKLKQQPVERITI